MTADSDAQEDDDLERDDQTIPNPEWDEMVELASKGEWEALGLDPPDFQPASIADFLNT